MDHNSQKNIITVRNSYQTWNAKSKKNEWSRILGVCAVSGGASVSDRRRRHGPSAPAHWAHGSRRTASFLYISDLRFGHFIGSTSPRSLLHRDRPCPPRVASEAQYVRPHCQYLTTFLFYVYLSSIIIQCVNAHREHIIFCTIKLFC